MKLRSYMAGSGVKAGVPSLRATVGWLQKYLIKKVYEGRGERGDET